MTMVTTRQRRLLTTTLAHTAIRYPGTTLTWRSHDLAGQDSAGIRKILRFLFALSNESLSRYPSTDHWQVYKARINNCFIEIWRKRACVSLYQVYFIGVFSYGQNVWCIYLYHEYGCENNRLMLACVYVCAYVSFCASIQILMF